MYAFGGATDCEKTGARPAQTLLAFNTAPSPVFFQCRKRERMNISITPAIPSTSVPSVCVL